MFLIKFKNFLVQVSTKVKRPTYGNVTNNINAADLLFLEQ